MNNPYLQKKGKSDREPMIMRIPMHSFTDNKDMEDSLLPYEICVGRIPNLSQEGFKEHVAIVYKDNDGKVYSIAMAQHHGVLKDTEKNRDAFNKIVKESETEQESKDGLKWSKK